jgi:AraC-like DNA-binding protein
MPLRPYLRWLRLQQALSGIARGANLTEAAHAAGFSDSAHLSRSFRSTFGIAPSALLHPSLSLHVPPG